MGNRRSRFGIGSLLMMLVFGGAFGGAGLFLFNSMSINSSWPRIEGKVVALGQSQDTHGNLTYAPTVQYTVSGVSHEVQAGVGTGSHPVLGSSMQVAYDPNDPMQAKVVQGGFVGVMPWLFMLIGAGFLVLAPVLFVRSMLRGKDISNLKQTGQKVQGVITAIQANNSNIGTGGGPGYYGRPMGSAMSSGNSGYRVMVSAPDLSGQVQNFVSDNVTGIGELAMADFQQHPIPIDVYINPSNPKDYYVDIEELPGLTPDRIKDLIAAATSHGAAPMSEVPPAGMMGAAPAAPVAVTPPDAAPPADPPPPPAQV